MKQVNFEVKTETGKTLVDGSIIEKSSLEAKEYAKVDGTPIYKTSMASYNEIETIDELKTQLDTDPEFALKTLTDKNRSARTDAGNKERAKMLAKNSVSSERKSLVTDLENMLAVCGLKLADLKGKTPQELAILLTDAASDI